MPRNFGLSHVSPRASLRANLPGLRARLLYSIERALQGAHHGFGKAHRPSGQPVSVWVQYMGRVVFAHGGNAYAPVSEKSARVRGKSR